MALLEFVTWALRSFKTGLNHVSAKDNEHITELKMFMQISPVRCFFLICTFLDVRQAQTCVNLLHLYMPIKWPRGMPGSATVYLPLIWTENACQCLFNLIKSNITPVHRVQYRFNVFPPWKNKNNVCTLCSLWRIE